MSTLLSEERPVARKDYYCDASPWIYNGDVTGEVYTFSELKQIIRAKRDDWKIKKGQRYVKQTLKIDGEICTYRAREDMDAICLKYGIFEDY